MDFDGLHEDKPLPPGGVHNAYVEDRVAVKATRQGAKDMRPLFTDYHYDAMGHLITETDTSGNTLVEYIYLNDTPLAMVLPANTVHYYHTDHLGTPKVMTSSSGAISWKALHNAYGYAEVDASSTITNNSRFPGHYYDTESGYHYNRNRYYDPRTGRYITADPIGLEGGINPFVYVDDAPVNNVDPEGLSKRKDICKQLASNLEGILKHGDHHIDDKKSMSPICSQLEKFISPFAANSCSVYYPELSKRATSFFNQHCVNQPEKCEDPTVKRVPYWAVPAAIGVTVVVLCVACPECCLVAVPAVLSR